ncbi:MAG: methyltransferase domain-containing protein [Bryobacterales bacterium]|nr:methyltransferase domain-containing protein [Bryobacterales bacterium]
MQNLIKTAVLSAGLEDRLPVTIAERTKKVYDRLSSIYHFSTMFFHQRAHRCALEQSGIRDGMRVLEIATGSGEMFRRLVKANPRGTTIGLDLSPKMAARTQREVCGDHPGVKASCQAVDARHLPFRAETFDAVMCCYLLELLSQDDILRTLAEVKRVLRSGGTFTLVLIGENTELFNNLYLIGGTMVPAFWGRQVENKVPGMLTDFELRIEKDHTVRQTGYPSRVLTARK